MTVLGSLDRFFGAPGAAATGGAEPRNLRWLPVLALGCLAVGYAGSVLPSDVRFEVRFAAGLLFAVAYGSSFYFRLFGPRIHYGIGTILDERERALRARSGHIAGWIIGVTAIASYFYFGLAALFGWWAPTQVHEWTLLGLALQAVFFILPVLIASWLQAPPSTD
jgi:hypothetical protein